MTERVWDENPWGADYLIYDDDKLVLRRSQNKAVVDDILASNQRARNNGRNGFSDSKELRRVASIPIVLYYELIKKYGDNCLQDRKTLSIILKEYPYLKTADGRV
jgi:hypothetical protein